MQYETIETIKQTLKNNVPLVGLPSFLEKHTIADRAYNNINNKTSFTYTEKEHFSYTQKNKKEHLN